MNHGDEVATQMQLSLSISSSKGVISLGSLSFSRVALRSPFLSPLTHSLTSSMVLDLSSSLLPVSPGSITTLNPSTKMLSLKLLPTKISLLCRSLMIWMRLLMRKIWWLRVAPSMAFLNLFSVYFLSRYSSLLLSIPQKQRGREGSLCFRKVQTLFFSGTQYFTITQFNPLYKTRSCLFPSLIRLPTADSSLMRQMSSRKCTLSFSWSEILRSGTNRRSISSDWPITKNLGPLQRISLTRLGSPNSWQINSVIFSSQREERMRIFSSQLSLMAGLSRQQRCWRSLMVLSKSMKSDPSSWKITCTTFSPFFYFTSSFGLSRSKEGFRYNQMKRSWFISRVQLFLFSTL